MSTNNSEETHAVRLMPTKPVVYRTLDAWRGLASLWVVLFHSSAPLIDKDRLGFDAWYVLPLHGYLGVWLFFVISGYCITNAAVQALGREQGLKYYTMARLRRIYCPCWFSLVLFVTFSAVVAVMVSHGFLKASALNDKSVLHQGLLFFFSNLTLTQVLLHQGYISDVCWTLCYEVAFYLVVGVLLAVAIRAGGRERLLDGLHVITVLSLLVLIVAPHWAIYPFDYWPQFGLGIMIYDIISHPERKSAKVWFGVAFAQMTAVALLRVNGYGYHNVGGPIPCFTALGFALLLLGLYRFDARLSQVPAIKWLSWVGIFSYSLYLTHVLIIGFVSKASEKLGLFHGSAPGFILVALVASVLVAQVFYQGCERPFIKPRSRPVPRAEVQPVLASG